MFVGILMKFHQNLIINISISVNIQDIPISSVTPHLQNHEQHNLCDIYNEAPLLFSFRISFGMK